MNICKSQAHRRRILPKISYTNFRKAYPNMGNCFTSWLEIRRFWSGRIINVRVKHFQLSFDFRKNWGADLLNK